jgi:hypothetical protein
MTMFHRQQRINKKLILEWLAKRVREPEKELSNCHTIGVATVLGYEPAFGEYPLMITILTERGEAKETALYHISQLMEKKIEHVKHPLTGKPSPLRKKTKEVSLMEPVTTMEEENAKNSK